MKQFKRAHISLGSNTGDRLENLKKAVSLIKQRAGKVLKVSPVYETPAWGFEGDDFLNACLTLDTELHPQELLEVLLSAETALGRIRTTEAGYQPRSIDLDILFYDGAIIDEPELKIPHPHIKDRKFILQPLADIAPELEHPVFKKDIISLLDECADTSTLTKTTKSLTCTLNDFSGFNYIAIEGNIGAGKTTLANMLSTDFNGKLLLEQFADNPFLPRFYEDKDRYAFPLEMSFLAERYQQFLNDSNQKDLFKTFMVSDYDIYKSLIFARVTLQDEEFKLYRRLFSLMYKDVTKPDIYIYLYQSTERLLENIKKRGRSYEQQIDPEYLRNINKAYLDFIKTQPQLNALIIDITDLDFVKNTQDYQYIIDEIHGFRDKR
ncbi:2-amino-4-hydroxy-6-hydroxymethyldihydropteridine diphosphokinase [Robertkochia marina]|uniref:2-amino-4-hydroxy-6-hydroxymethyldihydropteridine pyrophosphokinase n=1 Tax=Robertkochia marina TaxID=1227945 RepID=A0A4S3M1Q0_9FLAO|nr:2-amino-4-hydroxy-6-hydroxymethyldihydropteridine diphosphokinase [Robertkochia marina]THD68976.1 2-amino-4-hydroxy-6-hydroxymethyldihydropteridine diphosphokinase [Robertkochia marina]TRZ44796.1 2-amino-4-hydroxy-6-hydroxymethyldihydropteridine diphosphokinase [Robertkochia marina]